MSNNSPYPASPKKDHLEPPDADTSPYPSVKPDANRDGAAINDVPARIAAIVREAGFRGQDLVMALAVAKAESGWNPKAVSPPNTGGKSVGSRDWGLFQINDYYHDVTPSIKTNAFANAKKAYQIFVDAGSTFTPWSVYKSGAYKQYMNDATKAVQDLNKRGADWAAKVVATEVAEPMEPKLPGLPDWMKSVDQWIDVSLAVILGVTLIVLGVIILGREQVAKVANVIPQAKALGTVAKVLK